MSTTAIIAVCVPVGILAYIFIAGFIWELFEPWARHDVAFVAAVWPITLVCWSVYQIATAGPRIISWSRRPKIPKAKIVDR